MRRGQEINWHTIAVMVMCAVFWGIVFGAWGAF